MKRLFVDQKIIGSRLEDIFLSVCLIGVVRELLQGSRPSFTSREEVMGLLPVILQFFFNYKMYNYLIHVTKYKNLIET